MLEQTILGGEILLLTLGMAGNRAIGTICGMSSGHFPLLVESFVILVTGLAILEILMNTKLQVTAGLCNIRLINLQACRLEACQIWGLTTS